MKKIILAADTPNWVFANIAGHIARNSGHEVEVIYTADFASHNALARYLSLIEFDVCHFFWRLYYHRFTEYLKSEQDFDQLMRKRFTVSVPDFALLSNDYIRENLEITRRAAGMIFTNSTLADIYAARFPTDAPARVIHDPLLSRPDARSVAAGIKAKKNNPFRIAWVGNGGWRGTGQYEDYKGLGTVLSPLLPALAQRGIEADIIDSSQARLGHAEVMKRLENSHVLCMTSLFEGTSLPVLEAMANGNAVITTNTGIYPELLAGAGGASVVARNASAFMQAITALAADRDEWERQARSNLEVLTRSEGKRCVTQWDAFFEEVADRKPVSPQVYFTSARPRLGGSLCAPQEARDILCIASPQDRDMHDVGRTLFGHMMTLPINPADKEPAKIDATAIVTAIEALPSDVAIVFSGGDEAQQTLLSEQAAFFKNRETTLLWPGSIGEWQEKQRHDAFKFWNNQLTLGHIKGIAFFKEDMYEMFSIRRRRVTLVQNWVPQGFNNNAILRKKALTHRLDQDVPVRVAVLATGVQPSENTVTQLMAAGLACNGKLEVMTACGTSFDHILKPFNITALPLGQKLSQAEHSRAMELADVVLHIGFSDALRMIPLQAVQLGIPCIVGSGTNIYQGCPELEELLVVRQPDNMMEIRRKLEAVIADYPRITKAVHDFYASKSLETAQAYHAYYAWCRGGVQAKPS